MSTLRPPVRLAVLSALLFPLLWMASPPSASSAPPYCSDSCNSSAPCDTSCTDDGFVTTCGSWGTCCDPVERLVSNVQGAPVGNPFIETRQVTRRDYPWCYCDEEYRQCQMYQTTATYEITYCDGYKTTETRNEATKVCESWENYGTCGAWFCPLG